MKLSEAVRDPRLFRGFFKGGLSSWGSWLVFFKVLSGEVLDKEETKLFRECTGLERVPAGPFKEIFINAGRRSGKSTAVALIAAFYGVLGGWEKYLSRGERARIFIVSPTMDQGRVIKGYLDAIFGLTQALRRMVKTNLKDAIELRNGVVIEIKPASWRATRGFTLGLFIMEELAFWRFEVESANIDKEIYTAVKPSMSTIENSLTLGISTPFARQGLLYEKYDRHWGKPGPVLIWRAPTWRMNPQLSEEKLRAENLETLGAAEFNAEYGAAFREDIESYLPLDSIAAATVPGREFLGASPEITYYAFCDPSEGLRKGGDSMTFAISHEAGKKFILDVLVEFQPPFDPKTVISFIAEFSKLYKISRIVQDRHAIGWIASDLSRHKITVEPSELDKSKIYEHFAVLMSKRAVELLDAPRLRQQLQGLMKFLRSGGGVAIDHLRGGHDDVANAAAGAIVGAWHSEEEGGGYIGVSACTPDVLEEDEDPYRSFDDWMRNSKKIH